MQDELLGLELLRSLSVTGGDSFTLGGVAELLGVTRSIGSRRYPYMLTYRPEEAVRDCKWYKISLKLRLPRNWSLPRVNARAGYYAKAE